MNEHDAAVIEQNHRTQARVIAREPHIDTRPIFTVPCTKCNGSGLIDRYTGTNGMDYWPLQCSCNGGWRNVYGPLPTTKESRDEPRQSV